MAMLETFMALETEAMEAWRKGNPFKYWEMSHENMLYIDPGLTNPVVGQVPYHKFLGQLAGSIHYEVSEFINPALCDLGDIAILSYQYLSAVQEIDRTLDRTTLWDVTHVYARSENCWQLVHSHRSFTKQHLPDKVEVTIPIRFEELDYDETREWINLETAAMKRWRKGDPTGFFAICAEDVRYFDPFVKHRIDGLECLKKEILGRTFRTRFDVMEFIDPRVVIYGQKAAVLFYRFFSTTLHPNGSVRLRIPWNCSVIYRRSREGWKVVHTHRSYINGRQ